MSIIRRPHNYVGGYIVEAVENNSNETTLYDALNKGLTSDSFDNKGTGGDSIADGCLKNIKFNANAGITDDKLATITTPGKISYTALVGDIPATGHGDQSADDSPFHTGASITLIDAGGNYVSTESEGALQEAGLSILGGGGTAPVGVNMIAFKQSYIEDGVIDSLITYTIDGGTLTDTLTFYWNFYGIKTNAQISDYKGTNTSLHGYLNVHYMGATDGLWHDYQNQLRIINLYDTSGLKTIVTAYGQIEWLGSVLPDFTEDITLAFVYPYLTVGYAKYHNLIVFGK